MSYFSFILVLVVSATVLSMISSLQMGVSVKDGLKIIEAAHNKADILGVKVSVAVVDSGGHLVAFARQDGAPVLSAQIAEAKAVGAAVFMKDGDELKNLQQSRPDFFSQVDRLVRMPMIPGLGSILIRRKNNIIGSVGVSGASPEQDKEIAIASLVATDNEN
eukprot:gene8748-18095_t